VKLFQEVDCTTSFYLCHCQSTTKLTIKMSSGKIDCDRYHRDTADQVACCKLPPVEAEYSPKGSYEKINGYKTYVTGPEDSDKAIVAIYDVFGFSPQILQGESASF